MSGAIPAWGYVIGAFLCFLFLFVGMWAGYGRGMEHAQEEQQLEEEQYGPRLGRIRDRRLLEWRLRTLRSLKIEPVRPPVWQQLAAGEVEHEWQVHEDQALTLANPFSGSPPYNLGSPAITTGEIQAIEDGMDTWIAEHITAAPADYGQWLQQEDGLCSFPRSAATPARTARRARRNAIS